jgi:hypothetical protein
MAEFGRDRQAGQTRYLDTLPTAGSGARRLPPRRQVLAVAGDASAPSSAASTSATTSG